MKFDEVGGILEGEVAAAGRPVRGGNSFGQGHQQRDRLLGNRPNIAFRRVDHRDAGCGGRINGDRVGPGPMDGEHLQLRRGVDGGQRKAGVTGDGRRAVGDEPGDGRHVARRGGDDIDPGAPQRLRTGFMDRLDDQAFWPRAPSPP